MSLIPDVRRVVVNVPDVFDVLAATEAPQRRCPAGAGFAAALAGERVRAVQTALGRLADVLRDDAAAVRCVPRRVEHEPNGTHPNVLVP